MAHADAQGRGRTLHRQLRRPAAVHDGRPHLHGARPDRALDQGRQRDTVRPDRDQVAAVTGGGAHELGGDSQKEKPMTTDPGRRSFIQNTGILTVAASTAGLLSDPVHAATAPQPGGKPMPYQPKAMSFDPKAINGISEKVLTSHYENNYVGAVKRLNAIGERLAGLDFAKAPNFVINGLKREELI